MSNSYNSGYGRNDNYSRSNYSRYGDRDRFYENDNDPYDASSGSSDGYTMEDYEDRMYRGRQRR